MSLNKPHKCNIYALVEEFTNGVFYFYDGKGSMIMMGTSQWVWQMYLIKVIYLQYRMSLSTQQQEALMALLGTWMGPEPGMTFDVWDRLLLYLE